MSQPSDVLTARAAAAGAFDSLFLGLGAVALIVGAVGVANIMIISVLERRSEIGLRRALGATKSQIRTQFLAESILLAVIGGIVGVLAGILGNGRLRRHKHWAVVIPAEAWVGGIASAVLIGAVRRPPARRARVPDATDRGLENGVGATAMRSAQTTARAAAEPLSPARTRSADPSALRRPHGRRQGCAELGLPDHPGQRQPQPDPGQTPRAVTRTPSKSPTACRVAPRSGSGHRSAGP